MNASSRYHRDITNKGYSWHSTPCHLSVKRQQVAASSCAINRSRHFPSCAKNGSQLFAGIFAPKCVHFGRLQVGHCVNEKEASPQIICRRIASGAIEPNRTIEPTLPCDGMNSSGHPVRLLYSGDPRVKSVSSPCATKHPVKQRAAALGSRLGTEVNTGREGDLVVRR
jgi:hypothetical protein